MLRRVILLAALVPSLARPARAQTLAELTATPESTADVFLRSIRAIRWSTTAQVLHPRTLERFRTLVRMVAEADTTGVVRQFLTATDVSGFSSLGDAQVFSHAIGAMIDDMPGLMHAFYDHDDDVLGHVMEGADTAHVVYRTLARIGGAVPEVKVMQLARIEGGWRVLWSDELEVLDVALRGVTAPSLR